jgi:ATP-dependent Clp protease ATP-binding subunit ClpA
MTAQRPVDARTSTFRGATAEAQRLGDRRIGTQHLLLALLHNPISLAVRTLAIDLDRARAALTELDRAALAAIGLDAAPLDEPVPVEPRRRPPFTSGAKHVLHQAAERALSERAGRVQERHVLAALLTLKPPDPAAQLFDALSIDTIDALHRLD